MSKSWTTLSEAWKSKYEEIMDWKLISWIHGVNVKITEQILKFIRQNFKLYMYTCYPVQYDNVTPKLRIVTEYLHRHFPYKFVQTDHIKYNGVVTISFWRSYTCFTLASIFRARIPFCSSDVLSLSLLYHTGSIQWQQILRTLRKINED